MALSTPFEEPDLVLRCEGLLAGDVEGAPLKSPSKAMALRPKVPVSTCGSATVSQLIWSDVHVSAASSSVIAPQLSKAAAKARLAVLINITSLKLLSAMP